MRRLAFALVSLAFVPAAARAQLSPGELSRAHAALEGVRNCAACHEPGRGVTAQRCLTCHTALGRRIAAGQGLHARPDHRACERCHVEHQGRDFDLVFWGPRGQESFDHALSGFPLQGRHASLGCAACHTSRRIRDPAALARGGVNLARTFLGLDPTCAGCHGDPHRGQFAPRGCPDCHGQARWTPLAAFDHARTAFPLDGRHASLACADCHAARGGGPRQFAGTPQACASCHRDPHAGRLGPACARCHTAAGWTQIAEGGFDHGRTRFPLTGRHGAVACAKCHPTGADGRRRFQGIPFQTCASCHRDPHAGRLGAACATCHSTSGWTRITFGAFDHDRTGYPLRGRHAAVACDDCHRPGRPARPAHARCTDCHADRHAGQLARRPDGGRCEACHAVDGFAPARFTPEDHEALAFPLTGAHLAVPCDECHREVPLGRLQALGFGRGAAPRETEQLRFASLRCAECHRDPHGGQTQRFGACQTCHGTADFAEVAFDHSRTGFLLDGAHQAQPCRACHRPAGSVVAFTGAPRTCADCHRDPHRAQFAKDGSTDCARCHRTQAWAHFQFDHDRETSFLLEGAHRTVPCAGCHRRDPAAGGAVRYSGTGRACRDCHAAAEPVPRGGF